MVNYDEICLIFKHPKKTLFIPRYNVEEFDYFNNLIENINNFSKNVEVQNLKDTKRICIHFNDSFDFDINIFISRFKSNQFNYDYLYSIYHLLKAYDYFCLKDNSIFNIEIQDIIFRYYKTKINNDSLYRKQFIYNILKYTNHKYSKLYIYNKMKSNYIFDWDYIIDIHIEQFKLFKPLEQNLESYVKNNNVIELINDIKLYLL